jgi:hypothetical protein
MVLYYLALLVLISLQSTSFRLPFQWNPATYAKNFARKDLIFRKLASEAPRDTEPIQHAGFTGPVSSFENMEKGFDLEELGISIMIGKSEFCEGRGLFISLINNSITETTISMGSIVCAYSKGSFCPIIEGDKGVSFMLTKLDTTVIFNKEYQSIFDILQQFHNETLQNPEPSKLEEFSNFIAGHCLYIGEDPSKLTILPDDESHFSDHNIFLPHPVHNIDDVTIQNIGMFANDLAYDSQNVDLNETIYESNSKKFNCLSLVWRVELQENRIVPTWPIVMFNKDVQITNHEPMEIGMEYSWGYWKPHKIESISSNLSDLERTFHSPPLRKDNPE